MTALRVEPRGKARPLGPSLELERVNHERVSTVCDARAHDEGIRQGCSALTLKARVMEVFDVTALRTFGVCGAPK